MIELLYPIEGAVPLLTGKDEKPDASHEFFPVVSEDGTVLGKATREHCHDGSKLLHPVVHLHIIDREENIYLQKRSMKKDIMPGKWDTAVGGHVAFGESIMEALYRESREELGLTDFNPIYLGTYTYDTGRDLEFVNIFAAIGHFELHPDMDEVDEGRWITFKEADAMARQTLLTRNFKSEFKEIRSKLLALL